ncbi:UPF0554 protein C2orf43-like protein [Smittium culicis]|uniref:UPF0554 protein C2orf43-like protein n=2 Tax=Smittium culicis TaxID=133412 RepID=A0A1R1YFB8_9FUNG|nr:UPF0554 protein C2orf43-like protein [Smittium culicis]
MSYLEGLATEVPFRKALKVNEYMYEALVYPCTKLPKYVMLMIPGNPGAISFYREFLNDLHRKNEDQLEIIGVSLQGHSIYEDELGQQVVPSEVVSLNAQIERIKLLYTNIVQQYSKVGQIQEKPKFIICGHSVGSYICEQVFKENKSSVYRVMYLFPTVMEIAKSPNVGIIRFLFGPSALTSMISIRESSMPQHLRNMFAYKSLSYSTVSNFLNMAREEMTTINELDQKVYTEHGEKFFMYYGSCDKWVPHSQYQHMKQTNSTSNTITH